MGERDRPPLDYATPPPSRRRRRALWIVGAVVGGLLLLWLMGVLGVYWLVGYAG